jgi:ribonuclease E
LIRNDVIRRDTSPLPKLESGFEALELDHTAIYRVIAERDAVLQAEQAKLELDFEFSPQEPEFDESEPEEPKKAEEEKVVPAKIAPTPTEKPANTGFSGWMKRIFGGGGSDEDSPEAGMNAITETVVEERTERQATRHRSGGGGSRSRNRGRGGRSRDGGRSRSNSSRSADGAESDDRRGRPRGRSRQRNSQDGGSRAASSSSEQSEGGRTSSRSNKGNDSSSSRTSKSDSTASSTQTEKSDRGSRNRRGRRGPRSNDSAAPSNQPSVPKSDPPGNA